MIQSNSSFTKIAVVIPYYNAAKHIANVISKLPDSISTIIIIDDCGKEVLPNLLHDVIKNTQHLVILKNDKNLGVGGATKRGFQHAMSLDSDIVIKVDADDQMDTKFIPALLEPLLLNQAQMSKGNRFRDFNALKNMPIVRRVGNLFLSFLTKAATGYWNNFDPTNGFFAIKTNALKQVDFSKLSDRYFFETSLISQLYFLKAPIKDIPMPALYGDETSNMSVWHMPFVFSVNLVKVFIKRIGKAYFLYDFNIASLYMIIGIPLFLFGIIYGTYEWIYYSTRDFLAPTGTIMLVTLSIMLGFQLVLQAIQYDIINAPKPS